ncbi:MAG: DUF58 domain-containing protein [Planctomycetaceae bacterium]|nr:DUF58 domain-containing protein [Planctomycetaceae bacterium]
MNLLKDAEVQQALSRYQLGLPRLPTAGRSGELLGRGTGSSLEFQEYREYLPGDDLRHVDWGAYARSDALMVRLFREEISPRTELVLDASLSMTTHAGTKRTLALQLGSLFMQLVARLGAAPRLRVLNSAHPPLEIPFNELGRLEQLPFDGRQSLAEAVQEGTLTFKPQSIRIVISDFLFPHDPEQLVRRLAGQASALWLIQVLAEWEVHPRTSGGQRLIDVETAEHADLMLTPQVIRDYRERLQRLQESLQIATRRAHARFVSVVAEHGLERICQQELTRTEILRPV